jgi:hypothetical protein
MSRGKYWKSEAPLASLAAAHTPAAENKSGRLLATDVPHLPAPLYNRTQRGLARAVVNAMG